MELERRYIPFDEIRAVTSGDTPKIEGYFSVFNKWSPDLGGFREQVAPGTFAETIKGDDIRGLFNHDANYPLGRNKAGTMTLEEDSKGGLMTIEPPRSATWVIESVERGDVTGASFGFIAQEDEWRHFDGGKKISERTLRKAQLFDVGPVTFPAYDQTSVKVRSILANKLRSITEVGAEEREFDLDQILEIITRAKEGSPLTDSDIQTIRSHIGVLNGYLPTETEGPDATGSHDDGALRDLEHLARVREIELLEI